MLPDARVAIYGCDVASSRLLTAPESFRFTKATFIALDMHTMAIVKAKKALQEAEKQPLDDLYRQLPELRWPACQEDIDEFVAALRELHRTKGMVERHREKVIREETQRQEKLKRKAEKREKKRKRKEDEETWREFHRLGEEARAYKKAKAFEERKICEAEDRAIEELLVEMVDLVLESIKA